MIKNFRSNKQATEFVATLGVAYTATIEKMATAKYVVNYTEAAVPAPAAKQDNPKAARPQKVNRHYNDDGSLTIYVHGVKVRRIGGEDNQDASEEEIEDPDAFSERYLGRRFPKNTGGWIWGRTTQGHNWITKRQKALRARIADLEAAGQDTAEAAAELAKITPAKRRG